jgi:hypothetical protein
MFSFESDIQDTTEQREDGTLKLWSKRQGVSVSGDGRKFDDGSGRDCKREEDCDGYEHDGVRKGMSNC